MLNYSNAFEYNVNTEVLLNLRLFKLNLEHKKKCYFYTKKNRNGKLMYHFLIISLCLVVTSSGHCT